MRILVIDKEDPVVDFLQKSLRLDKHIVEVSRDGESALKKAANSTYDMIMMDLSLPSKSGLTVCKELRQSGVSTPIVIVSSKNSESSIVEGLNAGADDYVTKPFSYRELEARIRAVCRRPKPMTHDTIQVGELELDTNKKIIAMSGQPLQLRPKEYALLEYLMRHAGQVVPKHELLENVWLISANNASNRLEVCMYHIRRKINTKSNQLLKTIRGYGYVVDA